jgi:hypothetical protein
MFKLHLFGIAASFVLSAAVAAQPAVSVDPPHPTTASQIKFFIGPFTGCGQHVDAIHVAGQTIQIDVSGFQSDCVTTLPLVTSLKLSVPGTYTVRAIYDGPDGVLTGPTTTFDVTLAPEQLPATSPPVLVALALTLVAVGLAAISSHR